ncbi:hypothetical protein [Nostoc sp. LEGE 12450]|nr:hypothetical protein [Nostoc sp. LEGE 12450]MBE8990948.1 hypothetical protein [Nostoc sp. LEGE 12450]
MISYDGLFRDANSKTLCDEAIAIWRIIFFRGRSLNAQPSRPIFALR